MNGIAICFWSFIGIVLCLLAKAAWRLAFPKPRPKAIKPPTKWQRVLERYPIGKEFKHLGVNVIVRKAEDYWEIGPEKDYELGFIKVEYVDNNGVIREHKFTEHDADYLFALCTTNQNNPA